MLSTCSLASAMEASTGPPRTSATQNTIQPDVEKIKRRLLQKGVTPTPKIVHNLRKKELQKLRRKANRLAARTHAGPPLSESQKQALAEDAHFQTLAREYRSFSRAVRAKDGDGNGVLMVGKPWERLERARLRELASGSQDCAGEKLKALPLKDLGDFLEQRREELKWLLDDDIGMEEAWLEDRNQGQAPVKRVRSEAETVRFLVERLSATNLSMKDWKFSKMMKQSGLQFTEKQLLDIVRRLGANGHWRHALSIVEWVYGRKGHTHYKSRFVYTKLLAVLNKARRPDEALHVFNLMCKDRETYPDIAAYHSISVTLGQAGMLKELFKIVERMRQKHEKIKNMYSRNWDPILEPDVVVYNAVVNACVPLRQWKGVFWVLEQIRKSGLRPNGATYGLAMEVMLHAGKYDQVYRFFDKMQRSGEALKAMSYKILVSAYWKEGKIDEAIAAVRDMEQRGVVGSANVYYELACCLCNHGRWKHAMVEVEKLKKLPRAKELAITFTGMIMSAVDGGHIDDSISIFEHMKNYCDPNIGTVNAMLRVYGQHDMFSKAKELFEKTNRARFGADTYPGDNVVRDEYTYSSMLEACTRALQWEYFEYVYREMALSGYQLDQAKHASLLVEASRAGKWHLLEHAFDSILEAGEIPCWSIFMEMVCQAVAQQNFERAIALINTMGYAPFQVSEEQWTDIFEKDTDRISKGCLLKLLDALRKFDVAKEATVSNLLKSLQFLCGSGIGEASLGSIAVHNDVPHKLVPNGNEAGLDGDKRRENKKPISMTRMMSDGNDLQDFADTTFGMPSVQTRTSIYDSDDDLHVGMVSTPSCDGVADTLSTLCINQGNIFEDAATDECTTGRSIYNSSTNLECKTDVVELDLSTDEVDDLDGQHESDAPSAIEILAAWEQSRKSDETCFL